MKLFSTLILRFALVTKATVVTIGLTTLFFNAEANTCASAISVACGTNETGSTTGGTNTALATCVTTTGSGGMMWYTFTGDGYNWTFETVATTGQYDTKIWVFSGSCGSLTCVTGNDDGGAGTLSLVNFTATLGTTYYVVVGGYSANEGNYDLSISSSPCNPVAMSYTSSTTTQTNTSNAEICATSTEIIGVEVVTSGSLSPINITQLRVRTTGSTNPTSDITSIDIYYTGTSATFATNTLFGSAAPAVGGTNIHVGGTQTLATGTNYFWVVYNLAPGATLGNSLDALCNRVTVGGSNHTPSVTTPAGSRTIAACTPTPGNVGKTNLTAWFRASDLANGNVTSWTTAYPTGGSAITVTEAGAPYPVATNTPGGGVSNYNTTIYFDTTNLVENISSNLRALETTASLNLLDNMYAGNEGTFFGNYYFPTYFDGNDHMMCYNEGSGAAYFDGIQFRNLGASGRFAIGHLGSITGNANRDWSENHMPTTISYRGNRSTSASMNQYENSLLNTTNPNSQCSGSVGLRFGYKVGSNTSQYKGFLNEFIFFNRNLTDNEMLRIDSYLAVKYAITLDNTGGGTQGDYLATTSATIWDADASSAYHNNVIGIGRDDNENLLQKQSHTFDDTTRVYLNTLTTTNAANTGAFSADVSYVMVGSNTGKMCATLASIAEMPAGCGLYSRLEREWKVTKTNFADNFNLDVKLNACGVPGSVNVNHLRLLVDDDGDFSNGGTTCYYNGDGTGITISYSNPVITISGIGTTHLANNGTGFITVGSTNELTPLPVELVTYNAQCNEGTTALTWSTATETNNNYFTIEKSTDELTFVPVATIAGNGNSTALHQYRWEDHSPTGATTYYLLKQTDFNGATEVLGMQAIQCQQLGNISIFPNPFDGSFTIHTNNITTPMEIELYDATGRKVHHTRVAEKQQVQVSPGDDLPPGAYFLYLTTQHQRHTEKLIKAK